MVTIDGSATVHDGAAADAASPVSDGATFADASTVEAGVSRTRSLHQGRFDTRDAKGPRFSWPGSAIAATFQGTGIAVGLRDGGTNYFDVVVDGAMPTVVLTSGSSTTYSLASGLTAGQHTILLTKRTESNVGVVQFLGFTVTAGALVATPYPYARRIEYVGDSITCGYGDLGVGPSCSFSANTEDEGIAYGSLTSATFGAQQTAVAYSGIGVMQNYGGAHDRHNARSIRPRACRRSQ